MHLYHTHSLSIIMTRMKNFSHADIDITFSQGDNVSQQDQTIKLHRAINFYRAITFHRANFLQLIITFYRS